MPTHTRANRKQVQVITTDDSAAIDILKSDCATTPKEINWFDSSDRKWFADHIHWAMLNGRAIIINPR